MSHLPTLTTRRNFYFTMCALCSVGKVAVALVGAVCAAFALAADTLLTELTVLAAVIYPNLRGVKLW